MPTGTQVINVIPPGGIPIVRSLAAPGTLYTVAAGRRLHITAAWITEGSATTGGSLTILADVENDTSREVLSMIVVISAAVGTVTQIANSISINSLDIPVVAAGTVVFNLSGVIGGSLKGGFYGWEESVTK